MEPAHGPSPSIPFCHISSCELEFIAVILFSTYNQSKVFKNICYDFLWLVDIHFWHIRNILLKGVLLPIYLNKKIKIFLTSRHLRYLRWSFSKINNHVNGTRTMWRSVYFMFLCWNASLFWHFYSSTIFFYIGNQ